MKIRETFENRKKNGQKALVTYIVSGDYGYETTKENIRAMVKAGADVIEIGIPFSDPIAEGVVIQEASQHSLAGGTTLKGIFQMVKRIKRRDQRNTICHDDVSQYDLSFWNRKIL